MNTWDPPQAPPPPGFGTPATRQSGGAVPRILAWVVDAVILTAMTFVLTSLLGLVHLNGLGFILSLLLGLGYWTYCWGSARGQTVGDRLLHLRVVNANGGPLGYLFAFLRGLLVHLSFGICLIPAIVSLIMIAVTERHQAIHDLILGTTVVDA